jgi:hypothetical protein
MPIKKLNKSRCPVIANVLVNTLFDTDLVDNIYAVELERGLRPKLLVKFALRR